MALKSIEKIHKFADELREIRDRIEFLKDSTKTELDELAIRKEKVEGEILAGMVLVGVKSIKASNGDSITVTPVRGVDITNEAFALKWAIDNKAVSINKLLVKQILSEAKEIPSGFSLVERDSIRVTKAKGKNDETSKV